MIRQSPSIPEFDEIWIDESAWQSQVAERVRSFYPEHLIQRSQGDLPYRRGQMSTQEFNASKRRLWVKPYQGQFFKRCPGATQKKVLTCCNYTILNLGSQCTYNCSYCYLQSYLNLPAVQIYSNIEQALQELAAMAQGGSGQQPFRVGTGEVIDSLGLDVVTGYSQKLIEFFRGVPKWTLEFKTKSDLVDQFLEVPHIGNVVVSWSINPAAIVEHEDHGTANLMARLVAAEKCRGKGFQVAFHIDPMIFVPDWQTQYAELVAEICTRFQPNDVHVISVGALRFQPEQKAMMRERFGRDSWVVQAETFPSSGGKLRYEQRLREEMLSFVRKEFIKHNPQWKIFFCMETPETWISAFQTANPQQVPGLKDLFRPLAPIG